MQQCIPKAVLFLPLEALSDTPRGTPHPHPPPQVVRTALVDAASVSSLITTSECVVVEAPEDKKPAMPTPDMGMY
jgi:hypothetical protein